MAKSQKNSTKKSLPTAGKKQGCNATSNEDAARDLVVAEFIVYGMPVAQPRHKVRIVKGKRPYAMHYIDSDHPIREWKKLIIAAASNAMQSKAPTTLATEAKLSFVLPRPNSKKWKRKEMPRIIHTSKPDLDNLCKAMLDSISGIVFCDDRQVAKISAEKFVASGDERPRAEVLIKKLNMHEQ